MPNFYVTNIMPSPYYNLLSRVAYTELLEPQTLASVQGIIADAKAKYIDLRIFETYRSVARQEALYSARLTQLPSVGVHHYGLAADLVVYVNDEPTWSVDYSFMGPLAYRHGMIWGGPGEHNLNIGDMAHVQRVAFADQARLFDDTWYPTADYSPFTSATRTTETPTNEGPIYKYQSEEP